MKNIYLIFVLLAFNSCGQQFKQSNKTMTIDLSESVRPIVDSLVKFDMVHDEAIGYAGEESDVYLHFSKLLERSTDTELISLTDHGSPSVRVYAFWALAKRKNQIVKDIMTRHTKDSNKFSYMSGCSPDTRRVNEFYLSILTPERVDLDCIKLSSDELAQFKLKIGR